MFAENFLLYPRVCGSHIHAMAPQEYVFGALCKSCQAIVDKEHFMGAPGTKWETWPLQVEGVEEVR
jgi:hypothetical protein